MAKPDQIIQQQHAVADYLKALLTEQADASSSEQAPENWKQAPFRAQIVRVAGLKLAIPEHHIKFISDLSDIPSSTYENFQNIEWYLDTIQYQNTPVHRVDTTAIIFPPGYPVPQEKANYTVIINNAHWGLCCHQVEEVITIEPDTVTWRKQAGKRAWLAGTLLDSKLSIINVEELISLLDNTAKC